MYVEGWSEEWNINHKSWNYSIKTLSVSEYLGNWYKLEEHTKKPIEEWEVRPFLIRYFVEILHFNENKSV